MAREGGGGSNYFVTQTADGCPITDYPFSMTCWYYHVNNETAGIFTLADSTDNAFFGWYANSNNMNFYVDNSQDYVLTGGTGWYFMGISATSSTSRHLRVNTTTIHSTGSKPATGLSLNRVGVCAAVDATIGSVMPTGHHVADCAIWDRAIGEDMLTELFHRRTTPMMISNGLQGYWPLNNGTGNEPDYINNRLLEEQGTVPDSDAIVLNYKQRSFMAFKGTPSAAASNYNSIFFGSVF